MPNTIPPLRLSVPGTLQTPAASKASCDGGAADRVELSGPDFRFARGYSREELLRGGARAGAFVQDYLDREAAYFAVARHPQSGLARDGLKLDPVTGQPVQARPWSAPSKECLDLGVFVKALEADPKACRFVSPSNPAGAREEAARVLGQKLDTYQRFHEANPGYGGFLPWFTAGSDLTPTADWQGEVPGLDNGEWVWSMLLAERALRKAGLDDLADGYGEYNRMLRRNVVPVFLDAERGLVRADVRVVDPTSANSTHETILDKPGRMSYLTGEHGVHEGSMMVHYLTLFGEGLPEGTADRIWDGIRMDRVEHPHGTTWEAFWGSSHESWAFLFLPLRQVPEYRDLFRIREEIRTQNAAQRGYPGLATSTNRPGGDGYLDGAGIEGLGTQPIRNNHTYAIYGAFPLLLQFASAGTPAAGNIGLAWLHNMLAAPQMQGPLGGGESGTNDGTAVSSLKTIDGSLPNVLALMGGLERETAELLKEEGLLDRFQARVRSEYRESFGTRPLRSPSGFALPGTSIPTDRMPDYRTSGR